MFQVHDARYYEVTPPRSAAERLLIAARNQIYRDFISRMAPSRRDKILDVGVSDVTNAGANVLERLYPFRENITACGIGSGEDFCAEFPLVSFTQIRPNAALPFPNKFFAIATSNAVLEHVGSTDAQRLFVHELCRVAHRVFITVPHRFFPVEHHTAFPFVHYHRPTFELTCNLFGKSAWSDEENLILMTRNKLWRLAEGISGSVAVGYTGLRLGPFSSNLFLAVH